jgi:hypothetical protein
MGRRGRRNVKRFVVICLLVGATAMLPASDLSFNVGMTAVTDEVLIFDSTSFFGFLPVPRGIEVGVDYAIPGATIYAGGSFDYDRDEYWRDAAGAVLAFEDFENDTFASRFWWGVPAWKLGYRHVLIPSAGVGDGDVAAFAEYRGRYAIFFEDGLFVDLEPSQLFTTNRNDALLDHGVAAGIEVQKTVNPSPWQDHNLRRGIRGDADVYYAPGFANSFSDYVRAQAEFEFRMDLFDLAPERLLNLFSVQWDTDLYAAAATAFGEDLTTRTLLDNEVHPKGVRQATFRYSDVPYTGGVTTALKLRGPAIFINGLIPALELYLSGAAYGGDDQGLLASAGAAVYLDIFNEAVQLGLEFSYDFTAEETDPFAIGVHF